MPITIDTWPGPRKPSIRRSGLSRIALIVGTIVMWLQNTREIADARRAPPPAPSARSTASWSRSRGRRTPPRDPDSCARAPARRIGEYTMRTSAPFAFACSRLPREPGTRMASPNVVKITPGCVGDGDAVVDASHRQHADRAARAVHQLDLLRQHALDAVAEDRVRVAAAHLHDLDRPRRRFDGARQRGRSRAPAPSPCRGRGTRRRISCAPRADPRDRQQRVHQIPQDVIGGHVALLDAMDRRSSAPPDNDRPRRSSASCRRRRRTARS